MLDSGGAESRLCGRVGDGAVRPAMDDDFTYAGDLPRGLAESLQSRPGIRRSLRRLSGAVQDLLIPVEQRYQVRKPSHSDSDESWQEPALRETTRGLLRSA